MNRGWIITALVAATAVACLESDVVRCADGRLCAAGTVCDDANGLCVLPDQLVTCVGMRDGEACTIGATTDAICLHEVCVPPRCGDGIRTGSERCDLADLDEQDCTDHGFYAPDGLRCNDACEFVTDDCRLTCGDGVRNGDELCDGARPIEQCTDFGFEAGHLACDAGLCTPDFASCVRIGWHEVASTLEFTADAIPLAAIHGAADDDIWAVGGDGVALHYDGYGWAAIDTGVSGPLLGVWTADNGEAYAVGADGAIHWDGTAWSPVPGLDDIYTGVWGSAPDDVWVVGLAGNIRRGSGSSWAVVDAGATEDLRSVGGSGPDNVWVGSSNANVYQWNGTLWTTHVGVALTTADFMLVFADDDVYVSGLNGELRHWDGDSWVPPFGFPAGSGVFGSAPDDVYSVGGYGGAGRFDGYLWTDLSPGDITIDFRTGWSGSRGTAYAVTGDGVVYRSRGTRVERWDAIGGEANRSVFAIDDRLLMVGAVDGTINVVREGAPVLASVGGSVEGLWAAADDDAWLVTDGGEVHHFDGAGWTLADSGYPALREVWGSAAGDVYAVGDSGSILHNGGSGWSALSSPVSVKLSGVWGASASDVFAVGDDGTVLRNQGSGFEVMAFPAVWDLDDVWGSSADDVYAVGAETVIDINGGHTSSRVFHFDGTRWTELPAPNGSGRGWYLVGGSGADDVFLAGSDMWHYDGIDWAPVELGQILGLHVDGPRITIGAGDFVVRQLERALPWPCLDCD